MRPSLTVEFRNLGLRLKGTGKRVLAGVTGQLRGAHLTAIMGPSGAGGASCVFKNWFEADWGSNLRAEQLCRACGPSKFVQEHMCHLSDSC